MASFWDIMHGQSVKDAYAKARGEPTRVFNDVRPNPNHPDIARNLKQKTSKRSRRTSPPPKKIKSRVRNLPKSDTKHSKGASLLTWRIPGSTLS